MGLFQHKKQKSPQDQAVDAVENIFDEEFRGQLKEHGRLYFERVINENAALFKQDLDATVAHINTELRQHVARQLDGQFAQINQVNAELNNHVKQQLDEQFAEYNKTIENSQNLALEALNRSANALEEQHKQLASSLERSVASQDAVMNNAFNESTDKIDKMKQAQETALATLNQSVQAVQEQHQQLGAMLDKSIATQQELAVKTFQDNMAKIVEHYLLSTLGDQFDLKTQLPGILKQLEENKQDIAEDMKL